MSPPAAVVAAVAAEAPPPRAVAGLSRGDMPFARTPAPIDPSPAPIPIPIPPATKEPAGPLPWLPPSPSASCCCRSTASAICALLAEPSSAKRAEYADVSSGWWIVSSCCSADRTTRLSVSSVEGPVAYSTLTYPPWKLSESTSSSLTPGISGQPRARRPRESWR